MDILYITVEKSEMNIIILFTVNRSMWFNCKQMKLL